MSPRTGSFLGAKVDIENKTEGEKNRGGGEEVGRHAERGMLKKATTWGSFNTTNRIGGGLKGNFHPTWRNWMEKGEPKRGVRGGTFLGELHLF